jgi:hypothetical protein
VVQTQADHKIIKSRNKTHCVLWGENLEDNCQLTTFLTGKTAVLMKQQTGKIAFLTEKQPLTYAKFIFALWGK